MSDYRRLKQDRRGRKRGDTIKVKGPPGTRRPRRRYAQRSDAINICSIAGARKGARHLEDEFKSAKQNRKRQNILKELSVAQNEALSVQHSMVGNSRTRKAISEIYGKKYRELSYEVGVLNSHKERVIIDDKGFRKFHKILEKEGGYDFGESYIAGNTDGSIVVHLESWDTGKEFDLTIDKKKFPQFAKQQELLKREDSAERQRHYDIVKYHKDGTISLWVEAYDTGRRFDIRLRK